MPVLQRRPRRLVEEEAEEPPERPRQRPDKSDNSDGSPDANANDEADSDGSIGQENANRDDSADTQLINKLVRYALACDYSRTAIRREGIRERVLGQHSRAFRRIFDGAQKQLRDVFGMEMEELPARDKDTMTLSEKRKAKSQSRGQPNSNAWVLITRLPDRYRTAAILAPSKIGSAEDEAAFVGFYTLVISVIALNGGSLSDNKLRRYLGRMNAAVNMPTDKTENVLLKLFKQGYLLKTMEKRQDGEEDTVIWSVGSRGKVEVDANAVANLVREVYGGSTLELESKIQNSLGVGRESRPDEDVEMAVDPDASVDDGAGPSRSDSRRRSRRNGNDAG